jgi:hypothetical protein
MWAALNEEHESEARNHERETTEAQDAKNAHLYEQAIRFQQKNMVSFIRSNMKIWGRNNEHF